MALNKLKNHTKTWNQLGTRNILKLVYGFLGSFKVKKISLSSLKSKKQKTIILKWNCTEN